MSRPKPQILIGATPVYGHVMPCRAIAKELIVHGFKVTFVTGSEYEESIKSIGATFVPLKGEADLTQSRIDALIKVLAVDPPPPPGTVLRMGFIDVIPEQFNAVQRALKLMTDENPDDSIVAISEGSFRGTLPGILGAPGIKPNGHIALGVIPIQVLSVDTSPFGPGLPPDSSPEGRKRNAKAWQDVREEMGTANDRFHEILKELGARIPEQFFQDTNYWLSDRWLQLCVPSIEYPRSDAPSTIRFAGGLLPGARDAITSPPEWWNDVAINAEKKRIVFVSQGTIATGPQDLIVPTMEAFKDDKDFIVVVALGKKGFSLPPGTIIPSNARVLDFIPFDDILQYTDVFITNGGYGALNHSLSHGVPLIVAGVGADKAENAMRVEWAGVGINLRTSSATSEAIYVAAKTIVENPKYLQRSQEIQAEMKTYDPVEIIIQNIHEVVGN